MTNAAKQVDEKFVPFISSLPGFVEYYWIDLRDGAMISVIFWNFVFLLVFESV